MTFPEHHHSHVIFDIIAWGVYLWMCFIWIRNAIDAGHDVWKILKDRK